MSAHYAKKLPDWMYWLIIWTINGQRKSEKTSILDVNRCVRVGRDLACPVNTGHTSVTVELCVCAPLLPSADGATLKD